MRVEVREGTGGLVSVAVFQERSFITKFIGNAFVLYVLNPSLVDMTYASFLFGLILYEWMTTFYLLDNR